MGRFASSDSLPYLVVFTRTDGAPLAAPDLESVGRFAADVPALALPDKPSIVVLPFQSFGGEAEHDYFTDAITEDVGMFVPLLAGAGAC